MKVDKPKVGDVLYSLNVNNAARRCEQKLTPVTVTKVGNKYFTCGEGWQAKQYHIEDWSEKSDTIADSVLYKNPQDWEDEKLKYKLATYIGKQFDYGRTRLSLEAVKKIHAIIMEDKANGQN